MQRLNERNRKQIAEYVRDIVALPNESAKSHRFFMLAEELFPGAKLGAKLTPGLEKRIIIDKLGKKSAGRIDSYFGNVIIEFESSLRASERTALKQLRQYTAGVWNEEGGSARSLTCIATDGIVWKAFFPALRTTSTSALTAEHVELTPSHEIILNENSLDGFYYWLTALLFREGRINPSAEQFKFDFGVLSLAYIDGMHALRQSWGKLETKSEVKLAIKTWEKYLTVTYGSLGDRAKEKKELFLKHTYLSSVAKFLVWASISDGQIKGNTHELAKEILSGRYFKKHNIENLVESDFFQWVVREECTELMAPIWERTMGQMMTYDLARIGQDVLKGVYQELVDPKDRHDLGEYYTPDWLCDRIVNYLLPKSGFVSVLDPSCGSGSFLHATIAHQLNCNSKSSDAIKRTSILENVVGIDIHPLAAMISKCTYLLAMKGLIKQADRPVHIPVYLADSLFLPLKDVQLSLGDSPSLDIHLGQKTVSLPLQLIDSPPIFDASITACAEVALSHAEKGDESLHSLAAILKKVTPNIENISDYPAVLRSLWLFVVALSELISAKQDSIWAFIVRNAYRPAMLRGRFQFIVGNPPWLSYRYISDPEYQKQVKQRAVEDYKIAPKSQKLFTQMELATVFLVHSLKTYSKNGTKLGFVMPRSVLSSDQHENLRLGTYAAPIQLEEYWDLRDVSPVFQAPSCVLFASKKNRESLPSTSYSLPAVEWSGRLPLRDVSWEQAKVDLKRTEKTAHLIYLGKRNALSTESGSQISTHRSGYYHPHFNQGATIVPRNCYFVRADDIEGVIKPSRLYSVETDQQQAKLAKAPYKDVKISGQVEGKFLFRAAIAKHVLPYVFLDPAWVVLPIEIQKGHPVLRHSDELRKSGYRKIAKWMSSVEKIWDDKRGDKADRENVYQWLDYSGKLSSQNFNSKHLVLYNAAGTDVSACYVNRDDVKSAFVIDTTLYWAAFQSQEEAFYLVAVFNSGVVNRTIKPFQSLGLQGERHVHKKILELSIPRFRKSERGHMHLAELGRDATNRATRLKLSISDQNSLALQRRLVRTQLEEELNAIDSIVEKLLQQDSLRESK